MCAYLRICNKICYFNIYLCVCSQVSRCMCVHVCMHACVWRPEVNFCCCSSESICLKTWDRVFTLGPGIGHSDRLAGQLAPEILLSPPPLHWDYRVCWQAQIFTVVLGIKLRSLWLHNNYHMSAYRSVVMRTFTLFSNDHHVCFHSFSFPNWKPVPLNTSFSLFPSLNPGNPHYTFSLYVCD